MLYNWQSPRVKDIPKFEAGFDNCVIPGPLFWEYLHPWALSHMYFENAQVPSVLPVWLNMMTLESLCLMLDHALEDLQL
jgi:hypothetical protein